MACIPNLHEWNANRKDNDGQENWKISKGVCGQWCCSRIQTEIIWEIQTEQAIYEIYLNNEI